LRLSQKQLTTLSFLIPFDPMSIYDGIAPSVLSARLTEAQDAYHALNLGAKVVSIGFGDKKTAFTPADVRRLAAYIAELQTALSIASGSSSVTSTSAAGGLAATATWTR
jgi:hypothetical protein